MANFTDQFGATFLLHVALSVFHWSLRNGFPCSISHLRSTRSALEARTQLEQPTEGRRHFDTLRREPKEERAADIPEFKLILIVLLLMLFGSSQRQQFVKQEWWNKQNYLQHGLQMSSCFPLLCKRPKMVSYVNDVLHRYCDEKEREA